MQILAAQKTVITGAGTRRGEIHIFRIVRLADLPSNRGVYWILLLLRFVGELGWAAESAPPGVHVRSHAVIDAFDLRTAALKFPVGNPQSSRVGRATLHAQAIGRHEEIGQATNGGHLDTR